MSILHHVLTLSTIIGAKIFGEPHCANYWVQLLGANIWQAIICKYWGQLLGQLLARAAARARAHLSANARARARSCTHVLARLRALAPAVLAPAAAQTPTSMPLSGGALVRRSGLVCARSRPRLRPRPRVAPASARARPRPQRQARPRPSPCQRQRPRQRAGCSAPRSTQSSRLSGSWRRIPAGHRRLRPRPRSLLRAQTAQPPRWHAPAERR